MSRPAVGAWIPGIPHPPAAEDAPAARELADRRWFALLAAVAGMLTLIAATLRAAATPPFGWWRDAVDQAWVIVRRCTVPVILSILAFGFGAAGVEAGQFAQLVGSVDRMGASFVTASVREFAPWINGMVIAGVAGTAICADLGARKVREELDALAVLGIDPVRTLVVPRFVALGLVTSLMTFVALFFGALSGLAANVLLFNGTAAGYFATFSNNFTVPELLASVLKTSMFGFIIAIVCCYKGLHAKGGPEGVGRSVNEAVVIAFAGIWIFNFAFTSTFLAAFPQAGDLR